MSQKMDFSRHALAVSGLPQNRPHTFSLTPNEPERRALAGELDVTALRKLRFEGEIRSQGKRDFVLTGRLGATVVQPCVQTLEPVTTRIDAEIVRRYLSDWDEVAQEGAETEMPEDDTSEPLGSHIDPHAVMVEALALHIPDYPRAEDAPPLGEMVVTEPGKAPLRDEDTKPFAALAALKAKTEGGSREN
ncbi:YceD family protein [Marinovum sp.]|uniref:YceD family protein n=1 Tax=Marinovum sp. TaxID=2024839 RepID=UPI003A93623C